MIKVRGASHIFLALFTTACASYDKHYVDYGTVEDYSNAVTIDEVTVAAKPLMTEQLIRNVFDENLLEKNYYPIKILIQNNSNGRIFVLKDTVELIDTRGKVYRPVDAALVAEDFEDSEVAYGVLGFGVFSYASAKDANLERQTDYSTKQMPPSQVIPAGRRRGSFLYFRLPKDVDVQSSSLRLEVEHLDEQRITVFDLLPKTY